MNRYLKHFMSLKYKRSEYLHLFKFLNKIFLIQAILWWVNSGILSGCLARFSSTIISSNSPSLIASQNHCTMPPRVGQYYLSLEKSFGIHFHVLSLTHELTNNLYYEWRYHNNNNNNNKKKQWCHEQNDLKF